MTRRRLLLLFLLLPLTLAAYGVVLFVTSFMACGISGCSGGGFGPSYSPQETQVGLAVGGLVLLPVVLLALRGRPLLVRTAGGATAVIAGVVLAMALLELGPDGCPRGEDRATAGPAAFVPGAATCSGDRDAAS